MKCSLSSPDSQRSKSSKARLGAPALSCCSSPSIAVSGGWVFIPDLSEETALFCRVPCFPRVHSGDSARSSLTPKPDFVSWRKGPSNCCSKVLCSSGDASSKPRTDGIQTQFIISPCSKSRGKGMGIPHALIP